MGRKKIGGYIIEWYKGDHAPLHVHIYEDDIHLGRFDIENQRPMKGLAMTERLKKALKTAGFMKEAKNGSEKN